MRAARLSLCSLAGALLVAASFATPASAQNDLFDSVDEDDRAPASYTESVGRLTPSQIIQEKAQARAAQRMTRIAAREWYGYSQARPRTTSTPFTGLYGQHFQGYSMGRPAAHHIARPIVVVR